jgi:NADH-quinone oxidoreductase subunit N
MAIDFVAIAPEIALTVTALLVLAVDLALRGDAKQLVNPVAALGTVVAIGFTVYLWTAGPARPSVGSSWSIPSRSCSSCCSSAACS